MDGTGPAVNPRERRSTFILREAVRIQDFTEMMLRELRSVLSLLMKPWTIKAEHSRVLPGNRAQSLIQSAVDELLGLDRCPSIAASALRTTGVVDTVLAGHNGTHGLIPS